MGVGKGQGRIREGKGKGWTYDYPLRLSAPGSSLRRTVASLPFRTAMAVSLGLRSRSTVSLPPFIEAYV